MCVVVVVVVVVWVWVWVWVWDYEFEHRWVVWRIWWVVICMCVYVYVPNQPIQLGYRRGR
jgi:hypothetical protein